MVRFADDRQELTHLSTASHLDFEQFAPNRCDKVEDAVLCTRKSYVINEQSEQKDVRKQSREIHNLPGQNTQKRLFLVTGKKKVTIIYDAQTRCGAMQTCKVTTDLNTLMLNSHMMMMIVENEMPVGSC